MSTTSAVLVPVPPGLAIVADVAVIAPLLRQQVQAKRSVHEKHHFLSPYLPEAPGRSSGVACDPAR